MFQITQSWQSEIWGTLASDEDLMDCISLDLHIVVLSFKQASKDHSGTPRSRPGWCSIMAPPLR